MALSFLLAGLAFGNFFRYLATLNYQTDPRAHKCLLWVVMAHLAIATGLNAFLTFVHGVSQERTYGRVFTLSVLDAAGPGVRGVGAALVQGFLLVRAGQVSVEWMWRVWCDSKADEWWYVVQLFRKRAFVRAAFLAVGLAVIA